jgi:hypothetical protein
MKRAWKWIAGAGALALPIVIWIAAGPVLRAVVEDPHPILRIAVVIPFVLAVVAFLVRLVSRRSIGFALEPTMKDLLEPRLDYLLRDRDTVLKRLTMIVLRGSHRIDDTYFKHSDGDAPDLLPGPPATLSLPEPEGPVQPPKRIIDANLLVDTFEPGAIAVLTVAILLPQTKPRGKWQEEVALDPHRGPVSFSVQAKGFEVVSEPPPPIDIPDDRDSAPVAFQLRITESDERWIHILLTQAGGLIGELAITDFDRLQAMKQVEATGSVRRVNGADLLLTIRSDGEHVEADSPADRANLCGSRIGPFRWPAGDQGSPVRRQLKALYRGGAEPEDIDRDLKLIGVELARCLPEDLVNILTRTDIRTVMLRHDVDFDFPFELCYFQTPAGSWFLGDRIAICRWYLGNAAPPSFESKPVRSAAALLGKTPSAEQGIEKIRTIFGERLQIIANRKDVIEKVLKTSDFDLIHFIGHCQVNDTGEGGLQLADDKFLRLIEIGQLEEERQFGKAQPLVMLNACASGQPHSALIARDSFARRFLETNACAFIGTLWPVSAEEANEFAALFYERLKAGKSVAQAVLAAKEGMLQPAQDIPLEPRRRIARIVAIRSYCLFANPDLHFAF